MSPQHLISLRNLLLSDRLSLKGNDLPMVNDLIGAIEKDLEDHQKSMQEKQAKLIREAVKTEIEKEVANG